MSKILTTAATIIVLGLAATGGADARGGGGMGGVGHIGGMGGARFGVSGALLGGMGAAHRGGIDAAHMGGLGVGHVGAMGGTHVGSHARAAYGFARHSRRFDREWRGYDYPASCSIYERYYRPYCLGDVDSGIMSD
jgi:hypothetical protein